MIIKKKKKKDPQRLKHKVRFNIEFDYKKENSHKSKLIIAFVEAGSLSEKKFFIGDLIKSINGIQVKTGEDWDNETNKLNWGDEVFFEVERNNKIEKVNIKTISFEHYKENRITWGIVIKKVGKLIKIKEVSIEYNINHEIDVGDTLIAINSEKISSMEDFDRERSKYKVGNNIKYKIQKEKEWEPKIVNIKLISFNESIKINKKSCKNTLSKTIGTLLFKEWEETDYGHNHEDWNKRRDEIGKLDSIVDKFSNYYDYDIGQKKWSFYIRNWDKKDIQLIGKLLKPEYKKIDFSLNAISLYLHPILIGHFNVFNSKVTKRPYKNQNSCLSYMLNWHVPGGENTKGAIKNFTELVSALNVITGEKIDNASSEVQRKKFFKNVEEMNIEYISNHKGKLKKKKSTLNINIIKLSGFEEICERFKEWLLQICPGLINFDKKLKLAMKEWREGFFLEYPDFTMKRLKEIDNMSSDDHILKQFDDIKEDEESYDDEYQDDKKIYISTNVKKKKINGKDSFVVKLNNLPDDDVLQKLEDEGKKIYLKIYIYDVTDLKSDKYYEIQDTTGETNQYFSNNCHVIKTDGFSWSEGNNILVQSRRLKPYGEISNELAFPYSVMQLPKYGKRKLSFRSFICTKDQEFDENNGRFKWSDKPSFRAEEYYLDSYYGEYGFDEDGDYPEILSYTSSEIEVKYKQPGYLEVNRRKYDDLKLALSFALTQNEEENLKENFEKIKEDIRYSDGLETEVNIYKTLNLKKNYEKALNNKIKLDDILKDLKKNSVIHERYEIIDFLLNLATIDETFSKKENNFIDKVSKELELNKEKYQEIKKQKTASVKFVDFGDKADESVFGITKKMSTEEKLKTLRKEYSRWNALTNNSDKAIRNRAREMRDLAANLRSQYTK